MVVVDRKKKFEEAQDRNPHLKDYIDRWVADGNKYPEFYTNLLGDMAKLKEFNFIYPVGDPMFIHVFKMGISGKNYVTIEPSMGEQTHAKYDRVLEAIL